MTKLRVGFIGGGVVAYGHIQSLQKNKNAKAEVLADPSGIVRDSMAKEFGIPHICSDYRDILKNKDIDVVYICVPHYLHHPIAIEAFDAGKDVICEKPLALNAAQAEEMLQAARGAGKRLFLAENHRFIPENKKTKELMEEDQIGTPFLCLSCFIGNETERMGDPNNWKGTQDKAGGGVIIDNGPHILDTLHSLFGEVQSVYATGGRLITAAPNKAEDTAEITLRFKKRVIANLSLTFTAKYNNFPKDYMGAGIRYDIYGSEGSIHIVNEKEKRLTLINKKGKKIYRDNELPETFDMDSHFIDCLLHDKEPLIKAEDGLSVMKMIDACYQSSRTKKEVRL